MTIAWNELTRSPARDLSVSAIATAMQLTPPALYRYIGSREELLAELAVRVDEALAAVVAGAVGDSSAHDGVAHLIAIATALRDWAITHPHHYLLRASVESTDAASDAVAAHEHALADIRACFEPDPDRPRPRPTRSAAVTISSHERAVAFWARVHGLIGLELTGRLTGLGIEPVAHLEREITAAWELSA